MKVFKRFQEVFSARPKFNRIIKIPSRYNENVHSRVGKYTPTPLDSTKNEEFTNQLTDRPSVADDLLL